MKSKSQKIIQTCILLIAVMSCASVYAGRAITGSEQIHATVKDMLKKAFENAEMDRRNIPKSLDKAIEGNFGGEGDLSFIFNEARMHQPRKLELEINKLKDQIKPLVEQKLDDIFEEGEIKKSEREKNKEQALTMIFGGNGNLAFLYDKVGIRRHEPEMFEAAMQNLVDAKKLLSIRIKPLTVRD